MDLRRTTGLSWVLLLAAVLFLWNLWGYDLWAPDEPYFGEGAREMLVDGEWLVPHVNGVVTTDKPPLYFWLIALVSMPWGAVTSLSARLPSVLAALASLLLTMRLAERTAGHRTALLSGLLLATTDLFWEKARWVQIDALLCLLILVALTAFAAYRAGEWPGRRAGLVFWAAAGLAVLAKGPVGLLLPLGIALATLAADRNLGAWRRFAPLAGPAAFVAVVAPWVVAVSLWSQDYSVWQALREHFVERAIHGMHHVQPFWFYARVLPYVLLPWSLLVVGGVLLAWRRRQEPEDRFLLVWTAFVVVFFSLSTEKRVLYILPAVPAFAMLAARLVGAVAGWWDAGERALGRRWVTVPQGVIGAAFLLVGLAAPVAAPKLGEELVGAAWGLAVVLVAGGFAVLVAAARGRALAAVCGTAAVMAILMLVSVTIVNPRLDSKKSGRELAQAVKRASAMAGAADCPLLSLDAGNVPRAVSFYSGGIYLRELADATELDAAAAAGEVVLLVEADTFARLPGPLRARAELLYSTRLSRRDLRLVHLRP